MSKLTKMLEDTFAEAAFAESNVESGFGPAGRRKEKAQTGSVREWLDDTGAAVAFAQADDHQTAREIAEHKQPETAPAKATQPLVLVIGREDSFSDELVAYALDMAGRMNSAVMALNINPVKDEAYAMKFSQAAKESGVPFSHIVRSGNKDHIVEALSREHPNLQYVMTEPPRPAATSIPVYRPAPSVRARARAQL